MAGSSAGFHEAVEVLSSETQDRHRAIVSIMEELEAVDWYDQRIDAATDPELKALLEHNRDEEKEHACMLLEWLRRRDPVWDENMRRYLFTEGSILAIEEAAEAEHEGPASAGGGGSLGIGSLRGRTR